MLDSTKILLPHKQIWPWFENEELTVVLTSIRNCNLQKWCLDFFPLTQEITFHFGATTDAICAPVFVPPVLIALDLFVLNDGFTSFVPSPWTIFKTLPVAHFHTNLWKQVSCVGSNLWRFHNYCVARCQSRGYFPAKEVKWKIPGWYTTYRAKWLSQSIIDCLAPDILWDSDPQFIMAVA